jgi:hypothetical protein
MDAKGGWPTIRKKTLWQGGSESGWRRSLPSSTSMEIMSWGPFFRLLRVPSVQSEESSNMYRKLEFQTNRD